MAKADKKRGLGRGLSALMADVSEPQAQSGTSTASEYVPIEKVFANPEQPRKSFTDQEMEDLAASIKERGILQPLIVREKDGGYEIVAGDRRWRAAQRVQLHEVPVRVRDFSDQEVLEVAIIENVQRADLNPIEEATGYETLMERFGHTQEKLAAALGKSRSHIANMLRLMQLPEDVRGFVISGDLSAGHARALITADDPSGLARQVIKGGLSVRATEALVKSPEKKAPAKAKESGAKEKDADTRALEDDLTAALGCKVVITQQSKGEGGQLALHYSSFDQLDEILQKLSAG